MREFSHQFTLTDGGARFGGIVMEGGARGRGWWKDSHAGEEDDGRRVLLRVPSSTNGGRSDALGSDREKVTGSNVTISGVAAWDVTLPNVTLANVTESEGDGLQSEAAALESAEAEQARDVIITRGSGAVAGQTRPGVKEGEGSGGRVAEVTVTSGRGRQAVLFGRGISFLPIPTHSFLPTLALSPPLPAPFPPQQPFVFGPRFVLASLICLVGAALATAGGPFVFGPRFVLASLISLVGAALANAGGPFVFGPRFVLASLISLVGAALANAGGVGGSLLLPLPTPSFLSQPPPLLKGSLFPLSPLPLSLSPLPSPLSPFSFPPKQPFVFGPRFVLASLISLVGAALANAGGVGGGGLFVPMFNLLLGYDAKTSTALSKSMIMGGALASVCFNVQLKHPTFHQPLIDYGLARLTLCSHPQPPSPLPLLPAMIMGGALASVCFNVQLKHPTFHQPLIDYGLARLMQPTLLLGISVGVTCNVIFPPWLLTVMLFLLLLLMTYKTLGKGVAVRFTFHMLPLLTPHSTTHYRTAPHPIPFMMTYKTLDKGVAMWMKESQVAHQHSTVMATPLLSFSDSCEWSFEAPQKSTHFPSFSLFSFLLLSPSQHSAVMATPLPSFSDSSPPRPIIPRLLPSDRTTSLPSSWSDVLRLSASLHAHSHSHSTRALFDCESVGEFGFDSSKGEPAESRLHGAYPHLPVPPFVFPFFSLPCPPPPAPPRPIIPRLLPSDRTTSLPSSWSDVLRLSASLHAHSHAHSARALFDCESVGEPAESSQHGAVGYQGLARHGLAREEGVFGFGSETHYAGFPAVGGSVGGTDRSGTERPGTDRTSIDMPSTGGTVSTGGTGGTEGSGGGTGGSGSTAGATGAAATVADAVVAPATGNSSSSSNSRGRRILGSNEPLLPPVFVSPSAGGLSPRGSAGGSYNRGSGSAGRMGGGGFGLSAALAAASAVASGIEEDDDDDGFGGGFGAGDSAAGSGFFSGEINRGVPVGVPEQELLDGEPAPLLSSKVPAPSGGLTTPLLQREASAAGDGGGGGTGGGEGGRGGERGRGGGGGGRGGTVQGSAVRTKSLMEELHFGAPLEASLFQLVDWSSVFELLLVWAAFLALQLAKQHTPDCSRPYWLLNALQIPVALLATLVGACRGVVWRGMSPQQAHPPVPVPPTPPSVYSRPPSLQASLFQLVDWRSVLELLLVWLAFLALQLAKQHTPDCSRPYWLLNALQIPVALLATLVGAFRLYRQSHPSPRRNSRGRGGGGSASAAAGGAAGGDGGGGAGAGGAAASEHQRQGDSSSSRSRSSTTSRGEYDTAHWGMQQLWGYPLCSFIAGVMGGLLGIGGGMVMGPVLLELNLPPQVGHGSDNNLHGGALLITLCAQVLPPRPLESTHKYSPPHLPQPVLPLCLSPSLHRPPPQQVTAATTTFMVVFSSSLSVLEFYLLGLLSPPQSSPSTLSCPLQVTAATTTFMVVFSSSLSVLEFYLLGPFKDSPTGLPPPSPPPQQVTAATTTFMVVFSSSLSVLEFYLLGRIPIEVALVFAGIAMVAAFTGLSIVRAIVMRYGKPSVIIFALGSVIGLSGIILEAEGVEEEGGKGRRRGEGEGVG
ncbi:unnamed protein product [Closterium sp. Naga37s-1]|nr:unnamed protein product [Closterium sp. Naga37s-1]